ncbi:receptor-like protein kinase HSL1 [Gastrolobium bilobum]|uniref:receptor-like protein kinase HSL1 n=1 Tax=Gastrolobium bilobum TaxID=150636 RepID=UPI002AB0181F|nr:receptor-like protein kinase HSL1 [Gastrolobium bilobum]
MNSRQNPQPELRTRTSAMSKIPLLILKFPVHLFLLLIVAVPSQVISQPTSTEQTILLTLKRQLGDPPTLPSWKPSSSSPCDWPEIRCTGAAATELLLAGKNITVQNLPATICDLKNLTKLDLSDNSIAGEFPTLLYNCSNLRYLDLSQNYFAGAIPADINRLKTLTYLNLGGNSFTGDVPAAIGKLPELQTLHIFQNNFNGTFPKEIGDLSNLEILGLAYNDKLAPMAIPFEFGNLRSLKFMWITRCNLIGEIPESLGNLTSMEQLDLSQNNLTGSIPSSLFSLRNLTFLYLYRNRLSGVLPISVQALNLTQIDLATNNLTGSIPQDFGKLKNLMMLHLYSNQLSGQIPSSLGLIPSLKNLRVFSNKLNGTLPPELGLYSKLVAFEVADNQLSGGLPEHLCAGGALRGVIAFNNNLSGDLPQWLGNCASLTTVQLYNNKFSGEVPLGLWTLSNISTLMLSNNSFSGQLPSKLSWNMSRLEIRNNNFSGQISLGISSAVNLVVFDARNNLLSGEIPRELTGLSRLTTLMIDGNQLSGALPSEIISWQSLNTLTLSRNKISGQIPGAIGGLPNLVYVDLSENDISGEIPPQLANSRFVFLNLSSNKLSGNIPDEFNNLAYENSFLNNPQLCAYNPKLNLSSCLTKTLPHSTNSSSKFLALILAVPITVLLATASLAFYKLKKHLGKKHCGRKLSTWRLTSFQRLDLTEINLFSSLTENNLIGSGGFGKVYRIASTRPGEYVAVKKIWNCKDPDNKMEKEFMAEVEILGNIRHSNIVKLLCCYSSENSKLLVYEYMENQSLDKWLRRKKKLSATGLSSPNKNHLVLSWPTRLKIAIGAAQGLSYMHHDCSPPIIHRDVKSSNILLDSEFRASIADFGLAKMLAKPGELQSMSVLAGSFGYIPPEYAYSTKINEKVDVYSFGVVLLELVTGREPNSGGEHACSLVDWAWQHYSEGKCLTEAFDEDIKETRYAEEMTTVFKLGLVCTSSLPSTRPSMQEILQVLRQCHPPGSARNRVATEFDITPLLGDAMYISSYKDSNAACGNEESSLYSV